MMIQAKYFVGYFWFTKIFNFYPTTIKSKFTKLVFDTHNKAKLKMIVLFAKVLSLQKCRLIHTFLTMKSTVQNGCVCHSLLSYSVNAVRS